MRLMWLRAFRAVVQTGTVTGAAEILLRTQPQISRMIASLEDSVGLTLFDRVGRRLVPTPEALEFLEYIEPVLFRVEGVQNTAAHIRAKRHRPLVISAEPFLMHALVPSAITRSDLAETGSFAIDLCVRASGLWMSRQSVDLGVVALPFSQTDMACVPFVRANLVAVLPKGHRLTTAETVDIAELKGENIIALRSATLLRAQIDIVCARAGVFFTPHLEVSSGVLACELAAQGLGVTIADPIIAKSFADRVEVRPISEHIELTYGFLHDATEAHRQQMDLLMHAFASTALDLGGEYVSAHPDWLKAAPKID